MPFYAILIPSLIAIIIFFLRRQKQYARLPPGPRPVPLLGNIYGLPPKGGRDWEHWADFKQQYGPVTSLTILGKTIIILNDLEVATELLEKQSNASLDRPHLPFAMGMCGWGHVTSLLSSGHRLRASRKHFHSVMGTHQNLAQFLPLQDVESHRFLLRTLEQPKAFLQHIRTEVGAIVLKLAYGYTADEKHDPLVELIDLCHRQVGIAAQPGAWAVDFVPALKYIPDWLPGTSFKKTAREFKAKITEAVYRPAKFVEMEMAKGTNEPSFLSVLYDSGDLSAEDEDIAKYSAQSLYGGASDTTVSTLSTFFLLMAKYPEVQRKAQDEVDRVVGKAQLPEIEHRDHLPYIQSIIKEVLRLHPVAPTGLPHLMASDGICAGYHIPKGATVIANLWAIGHDPTIYSSPYLFNPDRNELDPRTWVFGFGRRACPGKLLAEQTLFLTIARTLAMFDIGENGSLEMKFEPGIVSQPEPFEIGIEVRSRECEEVVRRAEMVGESSAGALRRVERW